MSKYISSLYYLALMVIISKQLLADSEYFKLSGRLDNLLMLTYLLLMLIILYCQNSHDVQLFFIKGLCVVLCLYTCVKIGQYYILVSCLAVLCFPDSTLDNVLKIMVITQSFWLALHSLIYIGRGDLHLQLFSENSFGLTYRNIFATYFLWLVLEIIFIHFEALTWKKYLVITSLMGLFYLLNQSRTTFFIWGVFILILVLEETVELTHYWNFIVKYGFILFSVMSLLLITLYQWHYVPFWLKSLNELLTGRLLLSAQAFNNYGFSILGQAFDGNVPFDPFYGYSRVVIDNAYMRLFINFGSIYSLLVSYCFFKLSEKTFPHKMAIFLLVYLIFGLLEDKMLNATICFPLLFLGQCGGVGVNKKMTLTNELATDN